MYTQMKHGVRPMCSFLLLLAAAATLTLLVSFHRSGLKCEFWSVEIGPKPVFNKTLLSHAATDLADPGLERDIAKLSKPNIGHLDLGIKPFWFNLKRSLLPRFSAHLTEWARKRRSPHSGLMSGLPDEFKFLLGPGRRRFESCAVVGNSGILLQRDYGEAIDGYEAVFRLNGAGTRSFEKHVGSKTNVSFVNSNVLHTCSIRRNCRCGPYGPGVATVTYICQPRHFFDYVVCEPSVGGAPLAVTDPRFDQLCGRIVKYYSLRRFIEKTGKGVEEWGGAHGGPEFHYSSGMQAVMLAAGLCRRVGIFGFGKGEGAKHHYHTRQKAELALHDYGAEYEFYRDLAERPWAVPFVEGEFEFPPVAVYQ